MSIEFIEPWIQTSDSNFQPIIEKLVTLGYTGCIFESLSFHALTNLIDSLHLDRAFQIYNRKSINSNKKNPENIDNLRKENDLIAFNCMNAELTKWACQDQRVDLLQFSLNEINILADDSTIQLAKEGNKGIEIEYNSIIFNKYPIPYLRNIKKVLFRAMKKNLPVIFSSKASSLNNLRSKYSLIGFLAFIDMSDEYYADVSLKWLVSRLDRNRKRKTNKFISPGIWIKETEEGMK